MVVRKMGRRKCRGSSMRGRVSSVIFRSWKGLKSFIFFSSFSNFMLFIY